MEKKMTVRTHWTCMQVNIRVIKSDPYSLTLMALLAKKKFVDTGKKLPYTEKDVQSLMNNACGYYYAAFLHYINAWQHRTKDLYSDVDMFLHCLF